MVIILTLAHHSLKRFDFVHVCIVPRCIANQTPVYYSLVTSTGISFADVVSALSCGRAITPNLTLGNTTTGSTRNTQFHKMTRGEEKQDGEWFFVDGFRTQAPFLWQAVLFLN